MTSKPPTPPPAQRGETAPRALHWQSQLVLLLVLPGAAVWATVLVRQLYAAGPLMPNAAGGSTGAGHGLASAGAGLLAGAALALLVWRVRAATAAGAFTGGLLMACFCLTTPGWPSSAWPLLAMLVLTLSATRVSRAHAVARGGAKPTREDKHGRSAAQVAANLGVAALAGLLINVHGRAVALTVLLAALCEAAADTVSSELGQVLGGTPRLITTLRQVPAGTDGGISLAGTALGAAAAVIVAGVGVAAMGLPASAFALAAGAGVAGLLIDSLIGATLEQAGWLNNDAVNFLSTLAAASLALGLAEALR